MSSIDSALASVLANRIDTLVEGVTPGARPNAAQAGASAEAGGVGVTQTGGVPESVAPPPASAQAILSEVALTLDAISRFGGEATPTVQGEAPIWPSPPAIDASGAELSNAGSPAESSGAAPATTSVAMTTSASMLPVGALAAALEQTVADTGLFYESHLAQWLVGEYPTEALLAEPQAQLAAQEGQAPLAWADPAAMVDPSAPDAWLWSGDQTEPSFASPLPQQAAATSLPASLTGEARAGVPGYTSAPQSQNSSATGMPAGSPRTGGAATPSAGGASALSSSPTSVAASVHPATIPIVRQQLDLLATEQFRWTGEVWPGTKLDWIIEPEPEHERHAGKGGRGGAADEQAWHTRLTLALPTLGTVDADLVLKGTQLVVRVQASPASVARLATGGEAFDRRLRAAGIELTGLSIREVGGSEPAAVAGAAHAAAAYARAAAAATDAQPHEAPSANGDAAWGAQGATATDEARRPSSSPSASPLDHLFDDPFEWSGL
jgi:hypothetical protein